MKLPKKLSDLILLGLNDESKAHRSKKYEVVMDGEWHNPNGVCTVCFAGSVMAFSKEIAIDCQIKHTNLEFSEYDSARYCALDRIRKGEMENALTEMGYDLPTYLVDEVVVEDYEDNRVEWRKDMKEIAMKLKEYNL